MAKLDIIVAGNPVLRLKAKEVERIDKKTVRLLNDMAETMYAADGVGLAAPQVGVLKQIVVMDVDDENQYVLINPEIIETSGSQTGAEGCQSVPGKHGTVTRPNEVTVKAMDENMKPRLVKGTELLARAICHECDHLDGILYVDKKEGPLLDNEEPQEEEE